MDHLRPLLLLFFLAIAAAELTQDKAALLSFFSQSPHASRLQWNASSSACDWVGVTCDPNRTAVVALRLPGVGLLGPIAPNTLSRLSSLRVLSLRSNRLSGPIPTDLTSLSALRHLYLQNNLFSGEIPPELARLNQLVRLDISENRFSGEIPFGLNNLTRLTGLFLQNNSFSGSLPSIALGNLTAFDVSYNQLNGSIPRTLERFPPSSFAGNLGLCGGPLPPCSRPFFPPAPSPTGDEGKTLPKSKKRKLSTAAIIAIAVGAGVLFLLLLLLLFCIAFRRRRRAAAAGDGEGKAAKSSGSVPRSATTSGMTVSSSSMGLEAAAKNKLVFIDRGVYTFDLEDLLRASAEVLGKGTMGTSYKAVLEDGTTVVVKRLKDVMLQKKEFELQLESLGKARHANVVPLRAYYYSKDEKLLVYDYVPSGSLSAALHGSRGSGRPPVDWDTRLGISLATARGLAYLHLEAKVVHGDVKASNVLVRVGPDAAAVSDFGLWPLFGGVAPAGGRGAGYRAPEVQETRRPTAKSDVYSFGVVLLELLTGRSPTSVGEDAIDLPRWVQSVVREEWTAEVFDAELARYGGGDVGAEEEMVELLQVAMACCGLAPDRRPGMDEVVRTVEGIAERAAERGGGRLKPSSSSDAAASKGGESRGPTPPAAPTP